MNTAQGLREMPLRSLREVSVVHPDLAKKLYEFKYRLGALRAGYSVLEDWHPTPRKGWAEFKSVPFERSVVYRGDQSTWAYSHHQAITKFKDRYVVSWSNGFRHEDRAGQQVHYAWSRDGVIWSRPEILVSNPIAEGLVINNAGMCTANGLLYCYVCVAKDFRGNPSVASLREQHIRLDAYWSSDLQHWEHRENLYDNVYLFEGPRPTVAGRYLCCGHDYTDKHAEVLIWETASGLGEAPRVLHVPPSPEGILCCQGTWYQTVDGRIWMYLRDTSLSCRLGLMWSDDGGSTWSDVVLTDFPNTYSRAYAGRLDDGRFYIVGNNYDTFLDRYYLFVALSDDGYSFNRQYSLIAGNTKRRIEGMHKESGFGYPNCMVEGDRLFVTYSVNKEDIEVGIVEMSRVQ